MNNDNESNNNNNRMKDREENELSLPSQGLCGRSGTNNHNDCHLLVHSRIQHGSFRFRMKRKKRRGINNNCHHNPVVIGVVSIIIIIVLLALPNFFLVLPNNGGGVVLVVDAAARGGAEGKGTMPSSSSSMLPDFYNLFSTRTKIHDAPNCNDDNLNNPRRQRRGAKVGMRYYETDDDDFIAVNVAGARGGPGGGPGGGGDSKSTWWVGSGREFYLFGTKKRGGGAAGGKGETDNSMALNSGTGLGEGGRSSSFSSSSSSSDVKRNDSTGTTVRRASSMGGRSSYSNTFGGKKRKPSKKSSSSSSSFIQSIQDWIAAGNLPKIQCRVEPNTTLKVRKTFRPLMKTVLRLGADFNAQLGVWQFKSSWEDDIIGGKLTLAGRELQLSKTWLLSVGAVEDLVTRLRFRAAVDLGTMKAYARIGFRTERLSPINVVEGFTLLKQLPLDGNKGHVKLEVKANFAFPEPEFEYSTERSNHRTVVGMGDIEINIDELNLILDY